MKIESVAIENQQTKLIAEIEPEMLEKFRRQAARKISQNQKIPGFRPGKAPYDMVRRIYGDEALTQEAVELMLDDLYPQVLKEAGITPSGPGKLEEIVKLDPPTFAFIVPMPPAIELGDYKEIRLDYAPEPITDEQVDSALRRLQRSYATAEPVERAAEKGDLVSFKMNGKIDQPEEGEDENLVPETPYQMVAGEDSDEQEEVFPYEGFTNELIGLSAGDTKAVPYTFADESPYEDLRGKAVTFNITVDSIKEMHLPELNDEFAQTLGEFENVDALRNVVRTQLEQNYTQQHDQKYFDDLVNLLTDQAVVKYPPHMLDEEVEQFIHSMEHNLEHDRLDLDTYLKMRELDRETFVDTEVKPAAERRLIRSLVLEAFASLEGIEVKNEEVQAIYYSAIQQMQQSEQMEKGGSRKKKDSREMANSIAINTVNSIFNQRLMARLKAIAIGKGDVVEEETAVEEIETAPAGEAIQVDTAAETEQVSEETTLTSATSEQTNPEADSRVEGDTEA